MLMESDIQTMPGVLFPLLFKLDDVFMSFRITHGKQTLPSGHCNQFGLSRRNEQTF